jgi:argininosuccinate lyase
MGGKTRRKLWSGRFTEETDRLVEVFTASLPFDMRLYDHDIEGSIAHCRMLEKQGIIPPADAGKILEALAELRTEIGSGAFRFVQTDEDIHMAIERGLIERIGPAGGKVHTGRSRNDQVSLDMRLYLRDEIGEILKLVAGLQKTFIALARRELDTIMPGYTHMQKAQPVLLSHYLLAFREMLGRDAARLAECLERVNVMPLGSAALAGTSLPLDRKYTARLLGFKSISANSMDAVADRDFVAEFIFDASLLMMHLSRFCEDLIIWSSGEFGFVEISDAYTTGSSIMPQKKNPDVAELVRGKTGRVYGTLVKILTVLKGLHDLQPGPAGGQGTPLRHRRHGEDEPHGPQRDGRESHLQSAQDAGRSREGVLDVHRRGRIPRYPWGSLPGSPRDSRAARGPLHRQGERSLRSQPPGVPEILHGLR